METIEVREKELLLVFEVEAKKIKLAYFGNGDYLRSESKGKASVDDCVTSDEYNSLVELQCSGENQIFTRADKHTGTMPGNALEYKKHRIFENKAGKKLEISLEHEGIEVECHYQFYTGIPIVRSYTKVYNHSEKEIGLEYVSSFAYFGIDAGGTGDRDEKCILHIPHNGWYGECQWKQYRLPELGYAHVNVATGKKIGISSTGTWSSYKYLPMGMLENTEDNSIWFWQIENSGSWNWEIGDLDHRLHLLLSGPSENENHWYKKLKPGEMFCTTEAAIGKVQGSFENAMAELTRYRRRIRRGNEDNQKLPVIFNDYMNCLWAKPTQEKLLPLIDKAAEAGCEYFCIDAGWYSDGFWWDSVGEWIPSAQRFPDGIENVMKYIKSKGMVPGLWLELESMGINCPLVQEMEQECFFCRHGKPVVYRSRLQLDFRHPRVIAYANEVIDRLVKEYSVGYIKMDYNITGGIGTENDADSAGDGALGHSRAYREFIKGIFERYPNLVIENCSSGGMRMDYGMLALHSIQSITDQDDYGKNLYIAAKAATAATPEQAAIWSYPLCSNNENEVVLNMIGGMLCRIHLSGETAWLNDRQFELVKEGVNTYKQIRKELKDSVPVWPNGLPEFEDEWIIYGVETDDSIYMAVIRIRGEETKKQIEFNAVETVLCIYPSNTQGSVSKVSDGIEIMLPESPSGMIIKTKKKGAEI